MHNPPRLLSLSLSTFTAPSPHCRAAPPPYKHLLPLLTSETLTTVTDPPNLFSLSSLSQHRPPSQTLPNMTSAPTHLPHFHHHPPLCRDTQHLTKPSPSQPPIADPSSSLSAPLFPANIATPTTSNVSLSVLSHHMITPLITTSILCHHHHHISPASPTNLRPTTVSLSSSPNLALPLSLLCRGHSQPTTFLSLSLSHPCLPSLTATPHEHTPIAAAHNPPSPPLLSHATHNQPLPVSLSSSLSL